LKTYTIKLKDKDGNVIEQRTEEGRVASIAVARYLISDEFARRGAESTHEALGTDRVEVSNPADEIIFDIQLA
jgi:hypothetical protein